MATASRPNKRAPNALGVEVTAAAPPPLSAAELARLYPPHLALKLVQFIHRHGERTPVWPGLQDMVPPVHHDCHLGSFVAMAMAPVPGSADASPAPAPLMYQKQLVNAATWRPGVPAHHVHDFPTRGACYHGQLTDRGRSTLVALGEALRTRYVDQLELLPRNLADEGARASVYLRSTDYARTLESLHSLAAGLYPPETREATGDSAGEGRRVHEPMQIYTRTPSGLDNVYPDHECARYMVLRKHMQAMAKAQVQEKINAWPAHVKGMLDDKHGAVLAFDVLASALAHDWPLPISASDFELLRSASTHLWFDHIDKYDPYLPKAAIGRFVMELHELQRAAVARGAGAADAAQLPRPEFSMHVQHMQHERAKEPPRLGVYACHDTSIVPLLGAMGLWKGENRLWPYFAAHITIETFEDTRVASLKPASASRTSTAPRAAPAAAAPLDSHYVRVLYNDKPQVLPACAAPGNHHPGDATLCTYAAWRSVVQKVGTSRREHAELCVPVDRN